MPRSKTAARRTRSHAMIPDVQAKPGIDSRFLISVGRYIGHRKPDQIVQIGDFGDFPSLSSYDFGKKSFEGRRYRADVDATNQAWDYLMYGIRKEAGARYHPKMDYCLGNHEERIMRAIENDARLDGTIGYDDIVLPKGWERHDFLEVVKRDGVSYSHFFPRAASGSVMQTKRGAPSARAQVIREGNSATAGHQQGVDIACVSLGGRLQWGLVAGSCYLHSESYLSPQGNSHWRGMVIKNGVKKGEYSPILVDLKYIMTRYPAR